MKTRVILFFQMIVLIATHSLIAQHNYDSQSVIYSNSGKVGIGTQSPTETLDVDGNIKIRYSSINFANSSFGFGSIYNNLFWDQTQSRYERYFADKYSVVLNTSSGKFQVSNAPSGALDTSVSLDLRFLVDADGDVGIGTSSPGAKLHIFNGNNTYGAILANADENNFSLYTKTISTQPINTESFRIGMKYGSDENNGFVSFYRGGSTNGGFLGFSTNGLERMRISTNGTVSIGSTYTGPHKLAVDGSIKTKEVAVELDGWSDYVFAEDYELMDLWKVDEYVKVNKHLPGIPTEKEVLAEGIELGAMNAKLLEKIEELTLYIIDLDKKNKEQDILIKALLEQNESQ